MNNNMLKSCIQNFFPIGRSFTNTFFGLNNIANSISTLSRFNSVLSGRSNFQHDTFLCTNKTNILPVRTKMNIKAHRNEMYRVLNFDRNDGKRTSSKEVTSRFFRLHWGAWIRTIRYRDRNLYKKRSNRLRQNRQHVMCSASQSRLLDKMAGEWYTKPHYYVDDPYAPYHEREEYLFTRKRPLPPS